MPRRVEARPLKCGITCAYSTTLAPRIFDETSKASLRTGCPRFHAIMPHDFRIRLTETRHAQNGRQQRPVLTWQEIRGALLPGRTAAGRRGAAASDEAGSRRGGGGA